MCLVFRCVMWLRCSGGRAIDLLRGMEVLVRMMAGDRTTMLE